MSSLREKDDMINNVDGENHMRIENKYWGKGNLIISHTSDWVWKK